MITISDNLTPGSLCASSANKNYLKLFISRNHMLEVSIRYKKLNLHFFSDQTMTSFLKMAFGEKDPIWTKIS